MAASAQDQRAGRSLLQVSRCSFSGTAAGGSIESIEELKKTPVAESKSLLSSGDPPREIFAFLQYSSHGSPRKVGRHEEERVRRGPSEGRKIGRDVGL